MSVWVKPGVKRQFEEIAKREGLTLSRTACAALEEWLAQSLHIEHAGMIKPVIEQAIAHQMRAYSNRIAILLVRNLLVSDDARILAANILAKQPGVTKKDVEEILERSTNTAKRNLRYISSKLKDFIREIAQWILQGDEETPSSNEPERK